MSRGVGRRGEKRSRVTHPRYWNITEKRAIGMYLGEIELYALGYLQSGGIWIVFYIISFKLNNGRVQIHFWQVTIIESIELRLCI